MTDFTHGLRAPVLAWLREQAGEDWREPDREWMDDEMGVVFEWSKTHFHFQMFFDAVNLGGSVCGPFTPEKFRELLRKEKA
jgi:hypothetical protein